MRKIAPYASIIIGLSLLFAASAPPVSATAQLGSYRWRNDNGTEATATFSAAENAPFANMARNTPTRLRFAAGNDGTQSELLRKAALTLQSGESLIRAAVIDTIHGYAYFGTYTVPGKVIKVALGVGDTPPTRIGTLTLNNGEDQLQTAVIDPTNGYAYFGTNNAPGIVVKVALGTGDALPTRVSAVSLNTGENFIKSAVIDPINGYAYFGADTSPGIVVKVALGVGAAPPTRVDAVTLNGGENSLQSAVIDPTNGYAYFGTYTSPGIVVKVALGVGAALPTRVGAVSLNTGENSIRSAVIDPTNGYAYFGTYTSPGIVVKVALGVGAALPTRVGALTLNTGENQLLDAAVIDPTNGYAYFVTNNIPDIVVKVALGVGAALPTRVGVITLNAEEYPRSAVIDPTNGYAYFGSSVNPGIITKISIAPKAQFRLEYASKVTTCGAIVAGWTQVPTTAVGEAFQMADSTNLTDGAATTHVAGMTDLNASFQPGQVKDTSSQTLRWSGLSRQ